MIKLSRPAYIPLLLNAQEVKDFLNLHLDEPELIPLMESVQDMAEAYTKRSFTTRSYTLTLDDVPGDTINLPRGPVQSITSVQIIDEADAATAFDISNYYLTGDRLVFIDTPILERDYGGLVINYVAGDSTETPPAMRAGLLKAMSTIYENREDFIVGTVVARLPETSRTFFASWMNLS